MIVEHNLSRLEDWIRNIAKNNITIQIQPLLNNIQLLKRELHKLRNVPYLSLESRSIITEILGRVKRKDESMLCMRI
jgi:hypothetical protein